MITVPWPIRSYIKIMNNAELNKAEMITVPWSEKRQYRSNLDS